VTDRLPSLPLFVDDYEGATAHLTLEEDGAYMRLLRLCWRTPKCSIPDDPEWIMRRLRVDQKTYDRVVVPLISEFFKRSRGRLFQKRLVQEFVYAVERKTKRKEAGKKGGSAKALKNNEKESSNASVLLEQKDSNAVAPRPTPAQTIRSKIEGADAPSRRPASDPPLDTPDDVRTAFERHDAVRREFVANARSVELTSDRRRNLAARLKETGGLAGWDEILSTIRGSSFLRGETSRNGFVPTLDWVLKPANLRKIREGNFDDHTSDLANGNPRPASIRGSTCDALATARGLLGVD
jgi:uncharacterized protein YdaU (DUF1376 family)